MMPLNYTRIAHLPPEFEKWSLNPLNCRKLIICDGILTSSIFMSWKIVISSLDYIDVYVEEELLVAHLRRIRTHEGVSRAAQIFGFVGV